MCAYYLIKSGNRSTNYCNFKVLMSVNNILTFLHYGVLQIWMRISAIINNTDSKKHI